MTSKFIFSLIDIFSKYLTDIQISEFGPGFENKFSIEHILFIITVLVEVHQKVVQHS